MPKINPAPYMNDDDAPESPDSGMAWAPIFGGALVAIAVTLILAPLGTALGLGWVSPWHPNAEIGKAMTAVGAIWLVVVQWISSGMGGYLTGRLRTKWAGAHTHEVFFRDTVHGFLAWALATVVGAVVIMSVLSHMGGSPMMHGKQAGGTSPVEAYYTDSLFRTNEANANITEQDRAEATRILDRGIVRGNVSEGDRNYLSQLIAARTGIAPADADQRITNVLNEEKTALDTARKAGAEASVLLCLSLLIGAFVASVAGALGGRHRDLHYVTGRLSEL